jgi:hypothetical protein
VVKTGNEYSSKECTKWLFSRRFQDFSEIAKY